MNRRLELTQAELKASPLDVFSLVEKVGEGSYGSVFRAVHNKSGAEVAIKVIGTEGNGTDLADTLKEIQLMEECNCDQLVHNYGSYFYQEQLWIIMEFCGAGSVFDMMMLTKETMSEAEIAAIAKHVLMGLEYLHSKLKIHRDLKAGNVLLTLDTGRAKLADFGVAGQLADEEGKRHTVIGTPFWMAPEVIQEVGYDFKADIWSLGITCIEMAEGLPPLHNIHPMRAIFLIPTKPSPHLANESKFSKEFIDFLAKCLVKDPKQRATAKDLLNHPFIIKAKDNAVMGKIEKLKKLLEQGASLYTRDDIENIENDDDDGNGDEYDIAAIPESTLLKTLRSVADGTLQMNASGTMIYNATIKSSNGTVISPSSPTAAAALKQFDTSNGTIVKNTDKEMGTFNHPLAEHGTGTIIRSNAIKKMPSVQLMRFESVRTAKAKKPPVVPTNNSSKELLKEFDPFYQTLNVDTLSMADLNTVIVKINKQMDEEVKTVKLKYEKMRLDIVEKIMKKENGSIISAANSNDKDTDKDKDKDKDKKQGPVNEKQNTIKKGEKTPGLGELLDNTTIKASQNGKKKDGKKKSSGFQQ